MSWYSLRVISGKEQATKENILREALEASIEKDIEEVFLPYEKVIEVRNNKKRIKEKMFFPGYILMKSELDNDLYHKLLLFLLIYRKSFLEYFVD